MSFGVGLTERFGLAGVLCEENLADPMGPQILLLACWVLSVKC